MSRRRFLQATALGTAAATFLNKGVDGLLHVGPMIALANDLSENPCTAGDVEIVGNGIVINEPCVCTPGGTFSAQVQFTVRNNTSQAATALRCTWFQMARCSQRRRTSFCVMPMAAARHSARTRVRRLSTTQSMLRHHSDFPLVRMSLFRLSRSGAWQVRANTCTTIAWNTSPGAAGCTTVDQSPPGGQCRHQQVCIQGFGATLACKTGCTVLRQHQPPWSFA